VWRKQKMFSTPTCPRPHDSENTVGKFMPGQKQKDLTIVTLWPTPMAKDGTHSGLNHVFRRGNPTLAGAVGNWPTPTVCGNYNRKGASKTSGDGLATAVGICPTPRTHGMCGGSGTWKQLKDVTENIDEARKMGAGNGGQLNPAWVEKLMGWPMGWTDLSPLSHIEFCFWYIQGGENEENGNHETLRLLRTGNVAQEVRQAVGGHVEIYEAAFLLAELCEHAKHPDEGRIFKACTQILREELQRVREYDKVVRAPHRPECYQQFCGKHPNAMQTMSRHLARYGKAAWQDGSWENAIPRTAITVKNRKDKLKALGNGQVPAVVKLAWDILTDKEMLKW